ncbi:hypothetical protein P3W70_30405 [Achromobacter denitrificans]|uniref:hypothetical protein n=1 Tax=Achromobacter denitrificans TaxID=32002 RepID=UPI0023E7E1E5|nr:hypothetical protein [Achromobacter denitrificans]MDF3862706.1 hypothetical protein [Achromobacter denitrificans]
MSAQDATEKEVQADTKICHCQEDPWAADDAFDEKVWSLALERTLAMGLPSSIDLPSEVSRLGPATTRIYAAQLERLTSAFGDDLSKFIACANAAYWGAAWAGACWFELSITSGTVLDNDYTRSRTTPKGYLAQGVGADSMCSASYSKLTAPFAAVLRDTDAPRLRGMLDVDATLRDKLLSAMSCYFLHEADSMAAKGAELAEIMEVVSEAHDLREQVNCSETWETAIEYAHESPEVQRTIRSTQARAGALARLKRDKKQQDKALVYECWQAWQAKPESYPGQAAFARDMLTKCAHLVSTRTVEDWCREWGKAAASS